MKIINKIIVFAIAGLLGACVTPKTKKAPDFFPNAEQKSVVYVSYDVSVAGMEKMYQQILSQNKGDVSFLLYAPDSFLFNVEDTSVNPNEMIERDIPDEFIQVLNRNEHAPYQIRQHISARKKDSFVTKPHDFRFKDCLCYLSQNEDPALCNQQPWYPSARCQMFMRTYKDFFEDIHKPAILVILSRFGANERGGYDGAVKNMLGGNNMLSTINSLAREWSMRMANPDKATWFVNIVYGPANEQGVSSPKAIVASKNIQAAEIESEGIFTGTIGRLDLDTTEGILSVWEESQPGLYEWGRDVNLFKLLGQKYMPDVFFDKFGHEYTYGYLRDFYLSVMAERFGLQYEVKEIK